MLHQPVTFGLPSRPVPIVAHPAKQAREVINVELRDDDEIVVNVKLVIFLDETWPIVILHDDKAYVATGEARGSGSGPICYIYQRASMVSLGLHKGK
jgi:hypothetical protein